MLATHLYDAAGRSAYLAGFHAAQPLISERTGRAAKAHRGVAAELHRLTKDDPRLDTGLRAFLGRTYQLKGIADSETGPGSEVSPAQASEAIEAGRRFVAAMAEIMEDG